MASQFREFFKSRDPKLRYSRLLGLYFLTSINVIKNVFLMVLAVRIRFLLFLRAKTTMENILKPPQTVRNMKELQEDLFKKSIKLQCLCLEEVKISKILPALKQYLLKLEKFKPIQTIDKQTCIYLNPLKVNNWASFSEETAQVLKQNQITEKCLEEKTIEIGYENFSAEDVLRAVLPEDKEGLSSFTSVGHIVHVNLREHLLPFKKLIGKVLFQKVPNCKSVVNKINMIDNTYRNFKMEVLEGSSETKVLVKENRCSFEFDFATVYWNSRLCTEHERIVKKIKKDDVLFDVFAGVGPFAIPAAKQKSLVFANDLNPESFKWLNHNKKLNKIGDNLKTFNKDGKDFILTDLKANLKSVWHKNVYITMNLPALATTFLSCFVNLFEQDEIDAGFKEPYIFVYCFAKGEDYNAIAKKLVNEGFGFDVSSQIVDLFKVRTVSSLKEMMRVTIKLDRDILAAKRRVEFEVPQSKKIRLNDGKEQEEERVQSSWSQELESQDKS